MKVGAVDTFDIRFPTSRELDGSDAMNPDPDSSAAYAILRTDGPGEGHGFTFTIGRQREICRAAIGSLALLIVGLPVDTPADLGVLALRLPGLHDVAQLARVRREEARPAGQGGGGRCVAPSQPGFSAEMHALTREKYAYPDGGDLASLTRCWSPPRSRS